MDEDDRGDVRAVLMSEIDWPVSAGGVEAAAERVGPGWRDAVIVAASRLPDDGTWLTIDGLWADLDPLLKEAVHGL